MLKPDAVRRRLAGEIIQRFEKAGFRIVSMKMLKPSKELVEKHYSNLVNQYEREKALSLQKKLVAFVSSGEVVAMLLEGNGAIKNVRRIVGSTMPSDAQAGTIRGDYSIDSGDLADSEGRAVENLIHASGNVEEALFEIGLWFPDVK
jgi:nucleoside-diphosphate kinase